MNPRRIVTVSLLAAVAIGTPLLLAGRSRASTADQDPPTPPPAVTVATVEQRHLAERAEFTARIEAIESVEVRPRVSGHIVDVRFQAGQTVGKGDVLFVIDKRWQSAEVARTEASLRQVEVRVETATREHERAQSLLARKAISNEEAERRANTLIEAKAAVVVAEAAVRIARLELGETEIRSPIDGRISRALATVGNYVSGVPGFNTLLTTVVSQDPVHVYVNVDEVAFLKVRKLQAARPRTPLPIELGLGDETGFPRQGTLESFDNRVDATSGNIVLRATFANPGGLLVPGLFGRVRIATGEAQPVVLVPEKALGTDQGQRYVLALGANDVVEYRTVKLGALFDGHRVVLEGLRAGEEIVTSGLQRVRPGMQVTPERTNGAR